MTSANAINNLSNSSPITTTAVSYSALTSDYVIAVTSVAAARTITLPTASSLNKGKIYIIKNESGASTNAITIAPTSGTIDGTVSLSLTNVNGSELVYSDGSAWYSGSNKGVTRVNVQTFAASGTYVPTTGMVYCVVELAGGGGGAGGTPATGAAQVSISSGGGGGGYCRKTFSANTIGASQSVTIGGGGGGGTGSANGTAGGNSSFGALLTANGGSGGNTATLGAGANSEANSVTGGTASSGDINIQGGASNDATTNFNASGAAMSPSPGGTSVLGTAGAASFWATNAAHTGYTATGFGGGGGGMTLNQSIGSNGTGGSGTGGVCIVTEYISG